MHKSRYLPRWVGPQRWVFAGLAFAMMTSCSFEGRPDTSPFRYEQVIESLASGSATDRRPELRRCVEHWEPWSKARAELFEAMSKRGVLKQGQAALLEVGHSAWSHYRYAIEVDGVILPDPRRTNQVARGGEVRVEAPDGSSLRSHADASVDDGTCWFLTVVHDGRTTQVAVYGTLEGAGAGAALVRQLTPFLEQPAIPSQAR